MAFIKGPGSWMGESEEEGSGVLGGGAAVGGGGMGGAPVNSSWTNLQQYLGSNQGAGAGIANAITKSTQGDIDSVGQSRVEFEQKAKKQVDDNTRKDQYSSQIKADPTKINQDEYSSWKNLSNYWGPQDAGGADGYGEVKSKVDRTQNDISTANDYYGQNALANKAFSKGPNQYTQGMGYLDTFVARADDTGKQAFDDFKTRNAGFGSEWNDTQKRVNDQIGGAAARGKSAYDSVMGTIGSKYNETAAGVNSRVQGEKERGRAQAQLGVESEFSRLSPGSVAGDWSKYASANDAFGADDVASDAELQALNMLAGMDDSDASASWARGKDSAYSIDGAGIKSEVDRRAAVTAEQARARDAEMARLAEIERKAAEARRAEEEAANAARLEDEGNKTASALQQVVNKAKPNWKL